MARLIVFVAVAGGLTALSRWAPLPLLLADRRWPGSGWLQALLMGWYATVVLRHLQDPRRSPRVRSLLWGGFALVFFAQLLLGLAGIDWLLMTGELHLPVPALIVGGPLFRGGRPFMLLLFFATLAVVGRAWCSHLCYLGFFDHLAAGRAESHRPGGESMGRPSSVADDEGGRGDPVGGGAPGSARRVRIRLPAWIPWLRGVMLVATVGLALGLRWLAVSSRVAALVGAAAGVVGIAIMFVGSRWAGVMLHCTAFCPIGWLSDVVGRLNPWRIRFGPGCDDCGACERACRYGALQPEHRQVRSPGWTCALCGDCIGSCRRGHLRFHFPGMSPEMARTTFLVLVVALHTVFLAVARI